MSCMTQLSEVSKRYLCRFYDILDEMISGMTAAELTDSLSHNFIVQMIPHHEAAIQMSENLLQYTTFVPLQTIAQNIITEQTKGIGEMREALCQCAPLCSSQEDLCLYRQCFEQISQTMFRRMRQAPAVNNLNAAFLREMIPHHQGAIRMSENALRFPVCPELVPILENIITTQKKGVREMERLFRCL